MLLFTLANTIATVGNGRWWIGVFGFRSLDDGKFLCTCSLVPRPSRTPGNHCNLQAHAPIVLWKPGIKRDTVLYLVPRPLSQKISTKLNVTYLYYWSSLSPRRPGYEVDLYTRFSCYNWRMRMPWLPGPSPHKREPGAELVFVKQRRHRPFIVKGRRLMQRKMEGSCLPILVPFHYTVEP